MSATRTITLTGRPPVKIKEETWPVIAEASDHDYDGEYDFQANMHSRWACRVRRHEDGRAIVYATYSYETNFRNSRDYAAKAGVMLSGKPDDQAICDAIRSVCSDIAEQEHKDNDATRWQAICAECIADMPAETLD